MSYTGGYGTSHNSRQKDVGLSYVKAEIVCACVFVRACVCAPSDVQFVGNKSLASQL